MATALLVTIFLLIIGVRCSARTRENIVEQGRIEKFYVYPWPNIVDRYANYSDRPHHGHGVEFPFWRHNFGAGRIINTSNSEFKTSQFALFKIMYHRAMIDPRRTEDPNRAVSYFIPYDFGMDATFLEANGRMRRTQCPLAETVIRYLRQSPHFRANGGHDHTLVVSVNQNMNYFFNAQPCVDLLRTCWNCTKIAIDEYMFIAKDRHSELKNRGINWHAVPFPSDYHYNIIKKVKEDDDDAFEGSFTKGDEHTAAPWERRSENRTILVSFLGNARKFSTINTAIREALLHQCRKHPSICSHGAYKHDVKSGSGPNEESRKSVFCLQPPGDMPTRKSVFDATLSGCIPVLFHPLTARYMYEWHLGQKGWENIGVHFDTLEENNMLLNQTLDVIKTLENIYRNHHDVVVHKRQKIRELAHQLQYSYIVINIKNDTESVCHKVSESGELVMDAYDVTMDNIIKIHSGRESHNRTSHFLSCAQLKGSTAQTADYCSSLGTTVDPYFPPSVMSPLYKPK